MRRLTSHPKIECLEQRDCPAPLNFFFDSVGNLKITGSPASPGLGGLEIISGPDGVIEVVDGGITALPATPVNGNIIVQVDNGDDLILMDLTGGSLFGSVQVDMGQGDDEIEIFGAGTSIAGSVSLSKVNGFVLIEDVLIGGNVTINNASENLLNDITLDLSFVGGNFSYTGGTARDVVTISETFVGGNAYLSMSNGVNSFSITGGLTTAIGGTVQFVGGTNDDNIVVDGIIGRSLYVNSSAGANSLDFNSGSILGGNLTVIGGFQNDSVDLGGVAGGGTIGGNVYLNLGGGDNSFALNLTVGGSSLTYIGGINEDNITFDTSASTPLARVYMQLGLDNDSLTLMSANMRYLYVDFGFGLDTFSGTLPFIPVVLRNLP